jgi:CubicO group peptidase (beta-lactamase class C family)
MAGLSSDSGQPLSRRRFIVARCASPWITGLILALGAGAGARQASTPPDPVDQYVQSEMAARHIPGLALLVARGGTIVKAKGYGFANLEHKVPVKPETVFQSGSVGKQFTATALMMLVEEGKVGLDDRISKYFKDTPDSWKDVTVRRLLSHTAGFTDYPRDFNFREDYTEDQLLKRAMAIPLAFAPGEKWQYSNMGYVTLGILIGKVTGGFYGDFLQARIFRPLGMSATRIINEADIIPNRAAGYRLVKGVVKNQEWVSPTMNTTADGSLYFNVLDLAKWDAALYTEKLLKRSSLDLMWTPVKLNDGKPNSAGYGFAWSIGTAGGHRVIEHGGAWQGFTSAISRYVDDKLTVVVLANLAGAGPDSIAHHVAGLYVTALMPPPEKPIEDKEPQVTAFLVDLLQKLADGKAEPGLFSADLQKELFPDTVKEFAGMLKEWGPRKSIALIQRTNADGNRVYRYRVVFQDESILLQLTLTSDGKIARLSVSR